MRFVAFFAAIALAGAANAAVVYNNGGPNSTAGNDATEWVQAEDFNLGTATTLDKAGVYLAGYSGMGNWDGQLNWWIFGDAGGPASILASGSATPVATDSGTPWCCGGNAYLVEFSLNNFHAAAGTTYWLGIHAQDNGNWNRSNIYWVTTAGNNTSTGHESMNGTFDNWYNNSNEHAFYLTSAVPEPATWAMLIAGFGLVGATLRRRRLATA